ncbi:MAG: hypothetical protein ABR524_08605 [Thermoanaerobaculia bacterium]
MADRVSDRSLVWILLAISFSQSFMLFFPSLVPDGMKGFLMGLLFGLSLMPLGEFARRRWATPAND